MRRRRFNELARSDNALARTMRGGGSGVEGDAPAFMGEEDMADSASTVEILKVTLQHFFVPPR